jgi:hypothetical protein
MKHGTSAGHAEDRRDAGSGPAYRIAPRWIGSVQEQDCDEAGRQPIEKLEGKKRETT